LNVAYNTAVFKQDFSVIRKSLVERGQQFLQNASLSRDKIARLGCPFVTDGAVCYLQLFVVNNYDNNNNCCNNIVQLHLDCLSCT